MDFISKFFYASILLISILLLQFGDNLCYGFGKVNLTLINSLPSWLSEEVFFPLYFLEIELLNVIFLTKVFFFQGCEYITLLFFWL